MHVGFLARRIGNGQVIVTIAGAESKPLQKVFDSWQEALEWCDACQPRVQVFNRREDECSLSTK